MMPKSFLKFHMGIVWVLLLFLAVGLLRINDLSFYTPDSCRYLIWGNALAHGKGFTDDTQPVPEHFVINAPLYAVFLTLAELLFPLSVVAAKVWTLFFGAGAILLLYIWMTRMFGKRTALSGCILLASNPAFLFLSTEVLSEAPFIAAMILAGLLIEKWSEGSSGRGLFLFLLMIASFIGLLREAGLALVVVLVFYFLVRKNAREAAAIGGFAMLAEAVWYLRNSYWMHVEGNTQMTNLALATKHFVTPEESDFFHELVTRIWLSVQSYVVDLGGRLFYPLASPQLTGMFRPNAGGVYAVTYDSIHIIMPLIVTLGSLIIIVGIIDDIRWNGIGYRFPLMIVYLIIICAYPVHDIRFLLPLLPLLIVFASRGIKAIEGFNRLSFMKGTAFQFVMLAVIVFPNLVGLWHVTAFNLRYVASPDAIANSSGVPVMYRYQWQKLGGWIRANVPESCIIASPVKDIVLVSGNRKVLEIDPGVTLPTFESLLRRYQVDYLLAASRWSDLRDYEFLMRESRRFWFEPVPSVQNIMRVHSKFLEPNVSVTPHSNFDTTRTSELLRLGRAELMEGKYKTAQDVLTRALDRAPTQVAVLYQRLLAAMLAEDTIAVPSLYQKLLAMPQSLSYAEIARAQLNAYTIVHQAHSSNVGVQREFLLKQAAETYWQLGFYDRAADILDLGLAEKSRDEEALTKGIYYNLQNGDTSAAERFFGALKLCDSAGESAGIYRNFFLLMDSLRSAGSPAERSDFHFKLSSGYAMLGFAEEAVDEVEQSLYQDPRNLRALGFLAEVRYAGGYPRSALRVLDRILYLDPENRRARAMKDSLTTVR